MTSTEKDILVCCLEDVCLSLLPIAATQFHYQKQAGEESVSFLFLRLLFSYNTGRTTCLGDGTTSSGLNLPTSVIRKIPPTDFLTGQPDRSMASAMESNVLAYSHSQALYGEFDCHYFVP